ncbi:uncharacterized protein SPPG_08571 [Spizellomyces punctatus DAOM BR117]|uniref:MARVEL domain-containing protein n=1 Tax=Spizellomyces punctatus (strain DAOM BR117) TaxID=645134 RepID=A0A0L0H4X6_SPIPD|nr:uncharacterized protein SPPG_08571 [Spizellomyces punctatus DAOM BR117]KNC95966.1 hypothetical protein SPPG_08571 [Spizellomyces punctatus DAOM BR117]|eukprot:XP_016604006.1 hypothetical protein SPPG_08571 [Spizellomyces punctatus DAOM BR117]
MASQMSQGNSSSASLSAGTRVYPPSPSQAAPPRPVHASNQSLASTSSLHYPQQVPLTASPAGSQSDLGSLRSRTNTPANGTSPGSVPRLSRSSRPEMLPRKSGTHLLLYTRAVPLPKRFETITEYRFLMRMTQLLLAGAAFASLATASFNVNYTSAVLAVSGINLMCFTSISSIFVSFGCILVYCFPAFIGVPPHRHPRFSRVEVAVDLVYVGFWIAAPSVLVWYGKCPRLAFSTAPDAVSCLPWNMCTAFGYACAALFLGTLTMGVRDLKRFGFWDLGRGNGVMWARGSWKEWAES